MRSRPDQPGYSPVYLFLSFAPADGPLIQPTVQQHVESARIVRQDESMFMRKRQTDCDWRMIKLAPNSAKGAIAKVIDLMVSFVCTTKQLHPGHDAWEKDVMCNAKRTASSMLLLSARPLPARSKAVPWSGLVRNNGRPSVTLTPCCTPRYLTGISP